jgi:hypothetical protein
MAEARGGRAAAAALGLVLVLAASACMPLNALEDVWSLNGGTSFVTGEVRSLDARRGRIQVREEHGNRRTHTLRYDTRTRVLYQQRQYPASSLERGDLVRVRTTRDRSGTLWADQIEVRRSIAQQRTAAARVQRLDGVVRQVDTRRGYFTVEQSRSRSVVVYVPQRLNGNDARRFSRLRRGERVRLDVRSVGSNQAQLVRFR